MGYLSRLVVSSFPDVLNFATILGCAVHVINGDRITHCLPIIFQSLIRGDNALAFQQAILRHNLSRDPGGHMDREASSSPYSIFMF